MTAVAFLALWLAALIAWRVRAANKVIRAAQDGSYLQDARAAAAIADCILLDAELRGHYVPADSAPTAAPGETPHPASPAQGSAKQTQNP